MGQQDLTVRELVSKIERGDIQLPEMQRKYVWPSTRVRDLLDSLYLGYPSGTILTWEPGEDVPTQDFAVDQNTSTSQNFQLLLDGQQRLTSLSAILRGVSVCVRDRKKPIDILFNLEHPENPEEVADIYGADGEKYDIDDDLDEEIVDESEDEMLKRLNRMAFVVYTKKLANLKPWVSVTKVFHENSDAPFLKKAGINDMEDSRYEKYTRRLKQLRSIGEYSYRVHTIDRNKSHEEVTKIFVRVNSLGAKLRSSDLARAQITTKWKNFSHRLQVFEKECVSLGFDLEQAIHLKNLMVFATEQSRFQVVHRLSKEKLEVSWKDAEEGMRFALNFLRSNMNIDSPTLLSSPFIIITLAKYAALKNFVFSPKEEAQLRYWVLVANIKGRYSRGSTETWLDRDLAALDAQGLDELLKLLRLHVGYLTVSHEDLENKNSRSAYFKTMFMAFREKGTKDWRDQLVISLKHSGAKHKLQFHHIFPQAVLSRSGLHLSKAEINDICNLAFIGGNSNRKISDKEPSVYLPDVVEKIGMNELEKQCIPADLSLWEVKSYREFLSARRELVAARLNEFLGAEQ